MFITSKVFENVTTMANDAFQHAPTSPETRTLIEAAHTLYTVTGQFVMPSKVPEVREVILKESEKARKAYDSFMQWEMEKAKLLGEMHPRITR